MTMRWTILGLALLSACNEPQPGSGADDASAPDTSLAIPADAGTPPGGDAASLPPDASTADAGTAGADAGTVPDRDAGGGTADAGSTAADAGSGSGLPRPPAICAVPAEGQLVDTSTPKTVVGTGTPGSCTEVALRNAIQGGGIITFDCGAAPHTITVNNELRIDNHAGDVVLDGGGKITLSGGGASRILWLDACTDPISTRCDLDPHPSLTVQRLIFKDGHVRDTVANTKGVKTGGGAIYRRGGLLKVIDCDFYANTCDESGQDVSGGAITSQHTQKTLIVGSNFKGNACANGGAVGSLQAALAIFNSVLVENAATGSGGNRVPDAAHAGDTGGNGGNGGAIVVDGQNNVVELCGVSLSRNQAHYAGAALFRTGYAGEALSLRKSVVDANVLDRLAYAQTDYDRYNVALGGLYLQGVHATIEQTSITRNATNGGAAGLFVAKMGNAGGVLDLTNVTVAENVVTGTGLGGGLFGGEASGLLTNVTIARNKANFAGGIAFSTGYTLKNCIVAGNQRDDGDATGKWNPNSCFLSSPCAGQGANLQWPQVNATGRSDEPPCATGITFADPALGALQANGGTGDTLLPGASSPAKGKGAACPAVDQRGNPRPATACALGAIEP